MAFQNVAGGKGFHSDDADTHLFTQVIQILLGGIGRLFLFGHGLNLTPFHAGICRILGQHIEQRIHREHQHIDLSGSDRFHGDFCIVAGKTDEPGLAGILQFPGICIHPAVHDLVQIFLRVAVVQEQNIDVVGVQFLIELPQKLLAQSLVTGLYILAVLVRTAQMSCQINFVTATLDGSAEVFTGGGSAYKEVNVIDTCIQCGVHNLSDSFFVCKPNILTAQANGADLKAGLSKFSVNHTQPPFDFMIFLCYPLRRLYALKST